VINTELILADLASLQKRRDRLQKEVRAGSKSAKAEMAIIEKLLPHLDSGKPAVTLELTEEEKAIAHDFFLLTSKPTLFACNVAESDLVRSPAAADGTSGAITCGRCRNMHGIILRPRRCDQRADRERAGRSFRSGSGGIFA
jgi:hypothetical protein